MEKILNVNSNNELIGKIFRKYILEVDDAIEAHGFKATSYIDYAEDTIYELESKIKKQLHAERFITLEDNLKNTVDDIVENTKKAAYERNNCYNYEKIDKRANELHSSLSSLNTRFINRMQEI